MRTLVGLSALVVLVAGCGKTRDDIPVRRNVVGNVKFDSKLLAAAYGTQYKVEATDAERLASENMCAQLVDTRVGVEVKPTRQVLLSNKSCPKDKKAVLTSVTEVLDVGDEKTTQADGASPLPSEKKDSKDATTQLPESKTLALLKNGQEVGAIKIVRKMAPKEVTKTAHEEAFELRLSPAKTKPAVTYITEGIVERLCEFNNRANASDTEGEPLEEDFVCEFKLADKTLGEVKLLSTTEQFKKYARASTLRSENMRKATTKEAQEALRNIREHENMIQNQGNMFQNKVQAGVNDIDKKKAEAEKTITDASKGAKDALEIHTGNLQKDLKATASQVTEAAKTDIEATGKAVAKKIEAFVETVEGQTEAAKGYSKSAKLSAEAAEASKKKAEEASKKNNIFAPAD